MLLGRAPRPWRVGPRYAGSLAISVMLLACPVLGTTGCASRAPLRASGAPEPSLVGYQDAWSKYTATYRDVRLQAGCQPHLYAAEGQRRGAVLLYHGFSACPQQFEQLAPMLAAEGFDVLVPLLPGHGLALDDDGTENLEGLPTAADWEAHYGGLAARMNAVMAASPGERAVLGFSLGGAMALNGILRAPALYDRAVLLAPLMGVRGGVVIETLADLLGRIPGLRSRVVKPAGQRDTCDGWREAGRAGFCEYQIRHGAALVRLLRQNMAGYRREPIRVPMLVIAAGEERYVSNARIEDFVKRQPDDAAILLCPMPRTVPHEMLTPYENVGREMFWLEGVLASMADAMTRARARCPVLAPPES